MFNLDQEITKWRQKLVAGGITAHEDLDELESHLREDVEEQTRSGADAESAFKHAVQRMGAAGRLQEEFRKFETKRARKLKFDRYCLGFASIMILLIWPLGLLKSEMQLRDRLLGFGAMILSVVFLWSGRYISKILPALSRTQTQIAHLTCGLATFAWLMIYFYVILPRCNFTMGEVIVATIWAMTPCAMFGGITSGVNEAASKYTHSVG
jgi:hypothetical protein